MRMQNKFVKFFHTEILPTTVYVSRLRVNLDDKVTIKFAYQHKDQYRCSVVSAALEKMLRHQYHYLPREMPIARF